MCAHDGIVVAGLNVCLSIVSLSLPFSFLKVLKEKTSTPKSEMVFIIFDFLANL